MVTKILDEMAGFPLFVNLGENIIPVSIRPDYFLAHLKNSQKNHLFVGEDPQILCFAPCMT